MSDQLRVHHTRQIITLRGKGLFHAGTAVPADGTAGYLPGALFLHVDGAAGNQLFINEGTVTAADFNLVAGTALGALTATAAEINAAADVSERVVKVPNAAAYVVLAANSGKPHLIPDQTASITIDLPPAAAGLEYEFFYVGNATDAQNAIIDTTTDTNFFIGGVMFADHDAADAEIAPVYGDGDSNSILTIVTPAAGTRVAVFCDGTNWFLSGIVNSATIPTFADQS